MILHCTQYVPHNRKNKEKTNFLKTKYTASGLSRDTPSLGCVNTEALMIKPSKHILISYNQLMMVTGSRESNSYIGHDHSDRCYHSVHVFASHNNSISLSTLSLTCRSPPTRSQRMSNAVITQEMKYTYPSLL